MVLDKLENTVSHYLIKYGLINFIDYFWKIGVTFTNKNILGETPVSIAIKNNDD
jgi:hypothetical protein